MPHTAEFLSMMSSLDDEERATLMARHLRERGDASMTASLRPLVAEAERLETDPASPVWGDLPEGIVEAFVEGNVAHRDLVVGVWNAWVDVVNGARAESARAPARPPAGRRPAPSTGTSRCPSCGVPSVGLCPTCESRAPDVEHERRLYETDQDRFAHDRLRDERDHHDVSSSEAAGDAGSSERG